MRSFKRCALLLPCIRLKGLTPDDILKLLDGTADRGGRGLNYEFIFNFFVPFETVLVVLLDVIVRFTIEIRVVVFLVCSVLVKFV